MKKKRYYIAYGSNLSVEQMAIRCPDAKIAGMAALKDWKLVFKIHADIEPCDGRTAPVLVWEISEQDERSLDLYEGFPSYYGKRELDITLTDLKGRNPRKVTAMVYTMTEGHKIQMPMKGYYDVLARVLPLSWGDTILPRVFSQNCYRRCHQLTRNATAG